MGKNLLSIRVLVPISVFLGVGTLILNAFCELRVQALHSPAVCDFLNLGEYMLPCYL